MVREWPSVHASSSSCSAVHVTQFLALLPFLTLSDGHLHQKSDSFIFSIFVYYYSHVFKSQAIYLLQKVNLKLGENRSFFSPQMWFLSHICQSRLEQTNRPSSKKRRTPKKLSFLSWPFLFRVGTKWLRRETERETKERRRRKQEFKKTFLTRYSDEHLDFVALYMGIRYTSLKYWVSGVIWRNLICDFFSRYPGARKKMRRGKGRERESALMEETCRAILTDGGTHKEEEEESEEEEEEDEEEEEETSQSSEGRGRRSHQPWQKRMATRWKRAIPDSNNSPRYLTNNFPH